MVKRYKAYIVPEVNELFKCPVTMSNNWYFERQVDRWQIAKEKSVNHEIVIMGGDVFQPLWYNWVYKFSLYEQTLEGISCFFRQCIQENKINFPDSYFLLYININKLRLRKESDVTRKCSNFERHIELIEPQRAYFQSKNDFAPDLVTFVEPHSVQHNMLL
ncbi:chloramphenicol acetyltransferase [Paenibacillus illinoisensis]|uniref:chloramphenicol acetyltransferase n=1 Tax=Paenibacillus illinoisensis TaxID=59845 RepID=UPI0011B5B9E5|nr:chloramphenicol acetyltransferase [Paenibacillus illinoisensis]